MPIIKVWGLKSDLSEEQLLEIYRKIMNSVKGVKELGLEDDQISVFFPTDRMRAGLGEEVVVEISGFFYKPARTPEVLNRLAENVGQAVEKFFPEEILNQAPKIKCFVHSLVPTTNGFWGSPGK